MTTRDDDASTAPDVAAPGGRSIARSMDKAVSGNGEVVKAEVVDDPMMEVGAVGLRRSGGRITEEFLVELQGTRAAQVYKEMSTNDPIVGGILFAVEMLIRQVEWFVNPGGTDPEDQELADFVLTCMHDMEHPWSEHIAEVMSMLRYGFAPHEVVFKKRKGMDAPEGEASSKYDDGKIGWRKLPIRAQDSIYEWVYDDSPEGGGELIGVRQQPPPDYVTREIPIEKILLFRTTAYKDNPEGHSVLRNAYRPWYYKRSIEEIEAIGIERDLAGLPMARIPQRFFRASATAEERAALLDWVKTVRDVRRDSLEGMVVPSEFDGEGNQLYEFELLSTGGSRQIDTNEVITRKNVEIATTILADFILLGHEKVGSFALASSKTELFAVAVGGWLDMIAAVYNDKAIPQLLRLNGVTNLDTAPQIAYGDIEDIDLEALSEYLNTLAAIGFPLFPNEALMPHLLDVAGLPQPPDGFADVEMPEPEPPAPPTPEEGNDFTEPEEP